MVALPIYKATKHGFVSVFRKEPPKEPRKVPNPGNLDWGCIVFRKNGRVSLSFDFCDNDRKRKLIAGLNKQILNRTDRGNKYAVGVYYGSRSNEHFSRNNRKATS